MSDYAALEEAALEEEVRRRTEDIRATEEAADQAAPDDTGPYPAAEIAQVHRSGRHSDRTERGAYERPRLSTGHGARR